MTGTESISASLNPLYRKVRIYTEVYDSNAREKMLLKINKQTNEWTKNKQTNKQEGVAKETDLKYEQLAYVGNANTPKIILGIILGINTQFVVF